MVSIMSQCLTVTPEFRATVCQVSSSFRSRLCQGCSWSELCVAYCFVCLVFFKRNVELSLADLRCSPLLGTRSELRVVVGMLCLHAFTAAGGFVSCDWELSSRWKNVLFQKASWPRLERAGEPLGTNKLVEEFVCVFVYKVNSHDKKHGRKRLVWQVQYGMPAAGSHLPTAFCCTIKGYYSILFVQWKMLMLLLLLLNRLPDKP